MASVVVDPPVRPAALLAYVLARCAHPTTLVICSTSTAFVQQCVDDGDNDSADDNALHTASLLQVAVARHIRVAFVPTVAHLRGFLAAFDVAASRVPAPPAVLTSGRGGSATTMSPVNRGDRALVVYNFVQLHRGTSEWSSQGLGASAAVLVEAGWRTGLDVLVVDHGPGEDSVVLDEKIPVLSTAARKQLQRAGYALRGERIRAVLARWFTFRQELDTEDTQEEVNGKEAGVLNDAPVQGHVSPSVGKGTQEDAQDAQDAQQESQESEATGAAEGAGVDSMSGTEPMQAAEPVETRQQKTFVKDSEDEDSLADDEIYPIYNTV